MARLRYNGLATGSAGALSDLTLSGSHTNSTTTLTFNAALTHSNGTAVPTISGSDYFMLSILDGAGHVAEIVKVTAYTSGGTTATVTRGQEGTSGVSHSSGAVVVNAGTVEDVTAGSLLTSTSYNPGSEIQYTLTTSAADFDSTNLAVTFTGPASGNVLVRAGILVIPASTTNAVLLLRSGSTTVAQQRSTNGAAGIQIHVSHCFRVTGLTPGTSYTYKLGGLYAGSAAPKYAVGGDVGACTMEVWAA